MSNAAGITLIVHKDTRLVRDDIRASREQSGITSFLIST